MSELDRKDLGQEDAKNQKESLFPWMVRILYGCSGWLVSSCQPALPLKG